MNLPPDELKETAAEAARKAEIPSVNPPGDDDDLSDEVLGERQANACSMEPGCPSCE